jgi:hypothetical protein
MYFLPAESYLCWQNFSINVVTILPAEFSSSLQIKILPAENVTCCAVKRALAGRFQDRLSRWLYVALFHYAAHLRVGYRTLNVIRRLIPGSFEPQQALKDVLRGCNVLLPKGEVALRPKTLTIKTKNTAGVRPYQEAVG